MLASHNLAYGTGLASGPPPPRDGAQQSDFTTTMVSTAIVVGRYLFRLPSHRTRKTAGRRVCKAERCSFALRRTGSGRRSFAYIN